MVFASALVGGNGLLLLLDVQAKERV